jgi:DNA-binding beta-propeller fold protein YncE
MNAMHLIKAGTCAAIVAAAGVFGVVSSEAQTSGPRYQVDVNWPKPLPNNWVLGGLGGLCVDRNDHVFILNRQDVLPGELNAGTQAPNIIEIDQAGNVVKSWGDAKLLDDRLHSCHVDKDNNIWIASAPSGMIQKYNHDGKLLQTVGVKGKLDSSDGTDKGKPLNSNAAIFHMPSSIFVDPANGDIYVSDGEGSPSNQRVAVMDKSGKFLRQWKPEGMETVHCLTMDKDGMVYVCNRQHARIQVYDKMGSLKRTIEVPWKPATPNQQREFGGASVAIDFSPDQRLIYVINQNSGTVEVLERASGKVVTTFGRAGNYPGQFNQHHGIAVDSKGNIYLAENRGRRVQKFSPVQ